MQLYALDSKGRLFSAYQAKKDLTYLCPECHQFLKIRGGDQRRIHFYHIDSFQPCRQNGKSATHLALQQYFQKLLGENDCILEKQFKNIHRVADCFWVSKNKVIEIQCSMISKEEIKKRVMDYRTLGLEVIWILHEKIFNRRRVTAVEGFLRKSPHFFTDFNENGEGMIYRQESTEKGGFRISFGNKERVGLKDFAYSKRVSKLGFLQHALKKVLRK